MSRRRWAEEACDNARWARVEWEAGSLTLGRHGPSWEWYRTMGPVMAEEAAMAAWRGGRHLRRQWRRHHHHHHGPLVPLAFLFFFFVMSKGLFILGTLFMAMAVAALVVSVIMLARCVATPLVRTLAAEHERHVSGRRPSLPSAQTLVSLRPDGPAATLSPNEYRQRLLDVLKERYVRGEITVAEFEDRAAQIVRDPSVRHLS